MKVPKLRFEGFIENWGKHKLNEVAIYSNGGSYENDVKPFGKYQLVTLKSVDMAGNLVNSGKYIDKEVPTLNKGTLVMILSEQAPGLLGMTAQIPENNKYVLNQRVAEIRPQNNTDSYFLSMAINRCQQYFSKRGAGTKVQNISKGNVENFEFYCPIIEEQQKIGYFFKQLDKKIQLQQEKIDLLKEQKKGLLQKMFPKKGETQPEIRLSGFTDGWEQYKLGDIYQFKYGQFNNNPDNGGEYPIYGANGVIGGYHEYNAEDSIVIGHMGAYAGHVLWASGKHFVTYNGTIGTPKIMGFDKKFGYHMLQYLNIQKITAGSGQPFVSYADLENIKINIPINIKEQTEIGKILDQLDNLITLHQQKLNLFKDFKKSLMQQMFI